MASVDYENERFWQMVKRLAAPYSEVSQGQSVKSRLTDKQLEVIKRAERAHPIVAKRLLERGWHLPYASPVQLLFSLENLIETNEWNAIDDLMARFTRENLEKIEASLIQRFSNRSEIFRDAFEAHRDCKYTLSVPTFLAQIDGVGCEILDLARHYYNAKNRLAAIEKKASHLNSSARTAVVSGPLKHILESVSWQTSIAADTEQRKDRQSAAPWFGPLNRHGVLHGLDTDYHTELNSLRCVTILQSVLDVDEILTKDVPKRYAQLQELNRLWLEASA